MSSIMCSGRSLIAHHITYQRSAASRCAGLTVRYMNFSMVSQFFPVSLLLAVRGVDDSDCTFEDGGPELFRVPTATNLPAVNFDKNQKSKHR